MNKILIVALVGLIVAGSVIGALMYMPVKGVIPDGCPQGSMVVTIRELDSSNQPTGSYFESSVKIGPQPIFNRAKPMEAYNIEVQGGGLNPTKKYAVDFVANVVASEQPGVTVSGALEGKATITGITPNPQETGRINYCWYDPNIFQGWTTLTKTLPTVTLGSNMVFNFDSTNPSNYFCGIIIGTGNPITDPSPPPRQWEIRSTSLDNSVFHLKCEVLDQATHGLKFYGVTNADITITVDPDGNVNLTISSIEAFLRTL